MPPFVSNAKSSPYPPIPAGGDPRIRPSVMDRPGATPASDGRTGGTISDPQPARVEAGVETTGVGIVSSVLDMQRAFFRMVSNLLLNSDSAWWENRRLQRQMRNDPDIMSPLLQRQYAVALLEWNIVAEDEEDELQVEQAKHLKRIFDRMRRKHEFIKSLQEAIWYGPSMVNCIYRPGPMGFTPEKWFPIHPDSVTFDAVGNVGLLVGPDYRGATVPGHIGKVHMLTDLERKACVLHTFNHQAPDYEMPNESRYLFSGRGLREICFKFWLFKQIALQNWMKWVERYSLGIRVGTYPDGNDEAKAEMQQSLHNIVSDVSVVIPRIAGQTKDQNPYSIEILDLAGGEGQKGLVTLIEGYLAGQLKELIIGQTATTEPTAGGLGEGTSTRHAETFQRIIDMDAKALGDTLTFDFIEPLHVLNFGDTPYRPRVEAVIEKVDSEEFLAGVQAFVGMGGAVPERQVRSQLGIDEPRDDEPVLGGPQDLFGPDGMGGGPDGGGGGGGVEAFSRFRRGFVSMFGVSGKPWDESKHPRGQPENAGQFGPGGGGASNPVVAMAAADVAKRKAAATAKEKRVAKAKATVEKQVAAAGKRMSNEERVDAIDEHTKAISKMVGKGSLVVLYSMSLRNAEGVRRGIEMIHADFPQATRKIKRLQSGGRLIGQRAVGTVATYAPYDGAIEFSGTLTKDDSKFDAMHNRLLKEGWLAGEDGMASVATHEIGHLLYYETPEWTQKSRDYVRRNRLTSPKDLSEYGMTSEEEAYAEAVSAYYTTPKEKWSGWMIGFAAAFKKDADESRLAGKKS